MVQLHENFEHKWTYWFHSMSNDWSKISYQELYSVTNIKEYWAITNYFDKEKIKKGYLFIMKNNIFPTWEDESNKGGGCWSLKVKDNIGYKIFVNILALVFGNGLVSSEYASKVNGISINFKNHFYIKIWLKKNTTSYSIFSKEFKTLVKNFNIIKLYRSHKN